MDWIEDALRKFGQQLGIEDLRPGPDGELLLQLEDGSQVGVERCEFLGTDESLVYALVPAGYQAGSRLRMALMRCHELSQARWTAQVGLRGMGPDAMVLVLVRVPSRQFTAPVLGDAIEHLLGWMEFIRRSA